MKKIIILLLSLLTIQSISAGSLSLDAVDGSWTDSTSTTYIEPNKPINFYIRVINDNAFAIDGLSNGFRVYGPTSFTPVVGDTILPGYAANFDLIFAINPFSANGTGADTIGFGGAKLFGTGLPAGFNDVPYKISTGNVAESEILCLDSAFFPPSGTWKWASTSGDDFPTWDGPHCFEAKTLPCTPPTISNAPISLTGSHCDVMTFDFDALEPSVSWSSNIGTIDANGVWSYAPSLADVGQSIILTVTATGSCDASVNVNLTFTNEAPVLDCSGIGGDITTGNSTIFQLSATDCDPISWSIIDYGGVNSTIDPNSGLMNINLPSEGTYTITVQASDGNAFSTCDFNFNGIPGGLYKAEIGCVGDQTSNFVYQGQHVQVPVALTTGNPIGGYDILISYDNSVLSFQSAQIGADLVNCGWEYFTYRNGADGNCGSACPSGLVRVVAIAETNNGPNHPACFAVSELFSLDFLVSNDRTLECQQIPIRFFWMDCGDNAISSVDGNELHISEIVYDGDPSLFPPNGMEIQNTNYGYPTYFGAQDEDCFTDPIKMPIRDVSLKNGCVFIACADSIDARGDINLNNVANEIADAVLLSNYFIYGLGVFNVNVEGQIAASDINADGLTLSVADLVYMIRVILGDAQPYPKLVPQNIPVMLDNNILSINSDAGAAFIQLDGDAYFKLLTNNMEIKSGYDSKSDKTNILIYSFEGSHFVGEFLQTASKVLSIELATPEGALAYSKLIPADFSLSQNYPNPFNPTTTIQFSLSVSDEMTLTIYNVNGQQVAQFDGNYEAGVHTIEWDASELSSGVYFYKLKTSQFSDKKKMVLLK